MGAQSGRAGNVQRPSNRNETLGKEVGQAQRFKALRWAGGRLEANDSAGPTCAETLVAGDRSGTARSAEKLKISASVGI